MGKLLVFTGAGISADSGLSTFRDKDGLWENHKIESVCHGRTWKQNFYLVHKFYNARRQQLGTVQPNPAHEMVARLQKRYDMTLLTQNVDDLFERAGCENVIHLHGKLRELRCEACGNIWDIGYRAWDATEERCTRMRGSMLCQCKNGVRPNVVFFEELAPEYSKMYAALDDIGPGDVVLVIGTSGAVINPSMFASSKAISILCNLESQGDDPDAHIDDSLFDHVLHGRAAEKAEEIEKLVDRLMAVKPDGG